MSKQKTHNQKMREGAAKAEERIAEIYKKFKETNRPEHQC